MLRELLRVDLLDVSVVAFPAYPTTQAALRSMEAYRRSLQVAEESCRSVAGGRRRLRVAETL